MRFPHAALVYLCMRILRLEMNFILNFAAPAPHGVKLSIIAATSEYFYLLNTKLILLILIPCSAQKFSILSPSSERCLSTPLFDSHGTSQNGGENLHFIKFLFNKY